MKILGDWPGYFFAVAEQPSSHLFLYPFSKKVNLSISLFQTDWIFLSNKKPMGIKRKDKLRVFFVSNRSTHSYHCILVVLCQFFHIPCANFIYFGELSSFSTQIHFRLVAYRVFLDVTKNSTRARKIVAWKCLKLGYSFPQKITFTLLFIYKPAFSLYQASL